MDLGNGGVAVGCGRIGWGDCRAVWCGWRYDFGACGVVGIANAGFNGFGTRAAFGNRHVVCGDGVYVVFECMVAVSETGGGLGGVSGDGSCCGFRGGIRGSYCSVFAQ